MPKFNQNDRVRLIADPSKKYIVEGYEPTIPIDKITAIFQHREPPNTPDPESKMVNVIWFDENGNKKKNRFHEDMLELE